MLHFIEYCSSYCKLRFINCFQVCFGCWARDENVIINQAFGIFLMEQKKQLRKYRCLVQLINPRNLFNFFPTSSMWWLTRKHWSMWAPKHLQNSWIPGFFSPTFPAFPGFQKQKTILHNSLSPLLVCFVPIILKCSPHLFVPKIF